jgi:hypothetical protein
MPTNAKTTSGNVEVTIPLSVTDFAKGAREVIALLRDLGKLAGSAGDLFDRHKARGAAANLAKLSFERGGMREPLQRISAGNWSDEDIDSIELQLDQTASQVQDSIDRLSKYKDRLRQKFGMRAAAKLDEIIELSVDQEDSKPWIRDGLEFLVRNARINPDSEFIQNTAQALVARIGALNEHLIEMHDMVLPPKQSAKTKTTKKEKS